MADRKKALEGADCLFGAFRGIESFRARLLKKLGLRNNVELSRFAMQNQLIES